MNNYRIEYTCADGYSDTLYIQAANHLAAYMVCQEILADMSEAIISIDCYLEDEEDE